MATVIDNTGGDPTAFGKTMADIGTQAVNNRLNMIRTQQEQQRLDAQKSQFDLQHQLAKQQLDLQAKEFGDKHRAFESQMGGIGLENQMLAQTLQDPAAAPQPIPQITPADVAMPAPAPVTPSNSGLPAVQDPIPTNFVEGKDGGGFSPQISAPAPVHATPTNMPAGQGSLATYPGEGVFHPTPINGPMGLTIADFSNWFTPSDDKVQQTLRENERGPNGNFIAAPMTATQEQQAARNKVLLMNRLNPVTAVNQEPTAPVTPTQVAPVTEPVAPAPSAPSTPEEKHVQTVEKAAATISSPSVTPAQLLGHQANPDTSHLISSMLPDDIRHSLQKLASDPANKDIPIAPILQNYLKLRMAPLEQEIAQQSGENQLLQGQLDRVTTKQAIDMMGGGIGSPGNASPAAVNQRAAVYVKKLGWSAEQALAQARSEATGRPVLPKDQLDRVVDQEDKLRADPIAAAARENINSMETIKIAASHKNGQGDLALVDGFNQVVNKPGIKVSEGNVHLIQEATAIANKFSTDYWKNYFSQGGKMPEADRQKIVTLSQAITDAHVDYVKKNVLPQYEGVLEAAGINKSYIGGEFRNYQSKKSNSPNTSDSNGATPPPQGRPAAFRNKSGKLFTWNGQSYVSE